MMRRRFTLESPLPPEQARTRLVEAIGPVPTSIFHRDSRPFVGKMNGSSFDAIRASYGRNSFRPKIHGRIEPDTRGSRIHGTMQLHEIVMAVMAVFLGLPTLLLINLLLDSVREGQLNPAAPYAFGVILFLLAMLLGGFAVESRRALGDLAEIVEATKSEMT
jgi:hypothetical protein